MAELAPRPVGLPPPEQGNFFYYYLFVRLFVSSLEKNVYQIFLNPFPLT